MKNFRAALIGCGQVSPFQLRAWEQIEGVQVVALYNRTIEKARQRADEFGISAEHVYCNVDELLDHEQLDFVDIATAPHVHREQVEAAAKRGLHVLCQKPVAPSLEDICAMMAACDRAGVLFSVNENWRWRSWYREVKRLLVEGAIGRPRFLRFTSHRNITLPGPGGEPPLLGIKQPYTTQMERLIVFEWGAHLIDVTRFLLGDIRRVYASLDRTSPYFKGEDRAVVILELGQATGLIDISWATTGDAAAEQRSNTMLEHFVIEGDEGLIEVLPEPHSLLRLAARREAREWPVFGASLQEAYQESYTAAQRHFYECLRNGLSPETAASDNFKTMQATFGAYKSAACGQAMDLGCVGQAS
jgi:predicted dehydrogenase